MSRGVLGVLFAGVGLALATFWLVADPGRDIVRTEWAYVLAFSGVLLVLAVGLVAMGRAVGGRWALRFSLLSAAACSVASVVNVVEDGLGQEWAFFAFVVCLIVIDLGLLAMTIAIAVTAEGRLRWFALAPAGTLVGVLFPVEAVWVVMLLTWLAAASIAITAPRRRADLVPAGSP
jgi:hypothetical protein